jgi:ubiquitin thioesterase OTU1
MKMVAVRLRHPQGIATIQVPLGNDAFTVQDLQQEIYSVCGILPSQQDRMYQSTS